MNSLRAQISRILTWSCVDGPGNRMVLFFQGCNFDCLACHNPHTIGTCNDCGDCLPACPTPALALVGGRMRFEAEHCTGCDACLAACPIDANPMVRSYGVEDILDQLREHAAFLTGITVSGGEATMQLPFIRALFTAIGRDPGLKHLTRFIDSNGYLGAAGWGAVLDVTDGVMLDIKALDRALHHRLTGRDNTRSLASARLLQSAGKLHELRYLMIPGLTDGAAELDRLAEFARSLGGEVRIRLNAFRSLGVRGDWSDRPAMARETVEAAARHLMRAEVGPVELPAVW